MDNVRVLEIKSKSDTDLMVGILNGDNRAEDVFYLKYRTRLLRYANRLCRDPERSKDLVQDAVIVMLSRLRNDKFHPAHEGHILNSMKTTVLFILNNQRRKEVTKCELFDTDWIDDGDNIKESLFQAVEEALLVLDKKCRQLINSFYMKKMSMKEIATCFPNINTERYARQFKYRCTNKLKALSLQILQESRYE